MYRMRSWSVRNARWLKAMYHGLESVLVFMGPLIKRIGYQRLDKPFLIIEKASKGFLMDSQSCGQCIVGFTGLSCPMNCPKTMRNGPCGGVRPDGKCEVVPDMDCVWLMAWEGNKNLREQEYPIQRLQPALDNQLKGSSAWLRELRRKNTEEDVAREI